MLSILGEPHLSDIIINIITLLDLSITVLIYIGKGNFNSSSHAYCN
jgi:hypothetical protein